MEGWGWGSYKQLTCPHLSDGEFPCREARSGLEVETCLLPGPLVCLLLEGLKGERHAALPGGGGFPEHLKPRSPHLG